MKVTQWLVLACLAAAPLLMAETKEMESVSVTFDSLKGLQDTKGRSLDGSVKFYFADEGGPATSQEEISARGSTFTAGNPERACRLALVAAFISFQERAKREGVQSVVGMKTFATSSKSSKSKGSCLCRIGGRAYTTVKGKLVVKD